MSHAPRKKHPWTQEPPTREGWYWMWREGSNPVVVHIGLACGIQFVNMVGTTATFETEKLQGHWWRYLPTPVRVADSIEAAEASRADVAAWEHARQPEQVVDRPAEEDRTT